MFISVEPIPPMMVNDKIVNVSPDCINPRIYIKKSIIPNLIMEYGEIRSDTMPAGIMLIDEEAAKAPTSNPMLLSGMEIDLK
ncbi:MAG: hypothetical protein A2W53_00120 [Nitrospinae bacterium RIFCSPHIGHO2_02_39_11]|nr:MAG: hypothetical protein A2W53_00120 [Nitrospinae bacterium RIFCSPHIGHO2_02_39_11]